MRIAVVDDDPAIRHLVSVTVTLEGHIPGPLFADALDAMAGDWTGVDGAIVDYMMPHANGGELVAWLAEHHPDVRVCVLTAHPAPNLPEGTHHVTKDRLAAAIEWLHA